MPDSRKQDDLLREVIDRASTDREFRARLLADPASAIRHAFGVILPHNYRIRFIERPRELDALIVLPSLEHELDEEDLEQVAGGAETDECGKW
ncbi:NHLP leader peptide family RiPP precursor [Longimicrobium sp.]|uniref:NHLP leader peptide family RiPP precursor n=1 Tax=Longimicrobium sp. TaxID=2029185 RepID=UPI003B3AF3D9